MNPEERVVTWLISLGVLESPKKTICDPEEFLKSSLKNGVVLCKLINRLLPGSVEKVRSFCSVFGTAYYHGAAIISFLRFFFYCPVMGIPYFNIFLKARHSFLLSLCFEKVRKWYVILQELAPKCYPTKNLLHHRQSGMGRHAYPTQVRCVVEMNVKLPCALRTCFEL